MQLLLMLTGFATMIARRKALKSCSRLAWHQPRDRCAMRRQNKF